LEEQHAAIGLLVDRSLSIDSVKRQLGPTLAELALALNPNDEAFLMSFAGDTKLHVPLTSDRNRILTSIGKLKPDAGTRFYDAAIDAFDELSRSTQERKALIVLTDGADHYSVHTFEQLLRTVEQNRYETYIIGYVGEDSSTSTAAGRRQIRNEFNQLAAASGGAVYFPLSLGASLQTARQILESVHHEYKLGFYSSESSGASGVQVRVRGANRVTVFPMS
jgi:VWFA-related protein